MIADRSAGSSVIWWFLPVSWKEMPRRRSSVAIDAVSASANSHSGTSNQVVRVERVPVSTLAALWADIEREFRPAAPFLKLDTQGYDLQVLAGAGDALARVVGVQSEIAFKPLYAGMPTWVETVTKLQELGFDPTGFTPIAPKVQFPFAYEMNYFAMSRTRTPKD